MSTDNNKRNGKVTVHQVAKLAGVSVATVSRVLNDSPLVKESTREKVKQVLSEVGFEQPNRLARALRTNRTGLIALLIENILNPYYAVLAREVDDAAKRLGMMMFLANDDGEEKTSIERLHVLGSLNVDGILVAPWIGGGRRRETLRNLKSKGTCIVGLGDLMGEEEFDVVGVDYRLAAREATAYLADLGHRRIGFVGPPIVSDRMSGYEEEMKKRGLSPRELGVVAPVSPDDMRKALLDTLPGFIKTNGMTAILAHSDLYALEVIWVLTKVGMQVPDDVSVMGFDGVPQGENSIPPLSSVSAPYEEMARSAVDTIKHLVGSEERPDQVKKIFQTELVIRHSTHRPPTIRPLNR